MDDIFKNIDDSTENESMEGGMPEDDDEKPSGEKSFKEKAADFLNANGFFVVASLCILCLGIALSARFIPKTTPAPAATPAPIEHAAQQIYRSPVPSETIAPTHTPVIEPLPASAPAVEKEEKSGHEEKSVPAASIQKAPPPVEGDIIWGFAVDTLLYSKTLELWTTHEGIDISAKQGESVKAIKAGKVKRVYEDDALGVCVSIEHEGGLMSLYANLASKPPVSEGQPVNAGDTIGHVGATAMSEIALESHLHFALYKNGEAVDPSDYVL